MGDIKALFTIAIFAGLALAALTNHGTTQLIDAIYSLFSGLIKAASGTTGGGGAVVGRRTG